jgi:hypothetical protein
MGLTTLCVRTCESAKEPLQQVMMVCCSILMDT